MLIELYGWVQPQTSLLWHWLAACLCPTCITVPHLQAQTHQDSMNSHCHLKKQQDFTMWSVKSNAAFCKKPLTASFFYLIDICFFTECSERTSIASLLLSMCFLHCVQSVTVCRLKLELLTNPWLKLHASKTEWEALNDLNFCFIFISLYIYAQVL